MNVGVKAYYKGEEISLTNIGKFLPANVSAVTVTTLTRRASEEYVEDEERG